MPPGRVLSPRLPHETVNLCTLRQAWLGAGAGAGQCTGRHRKAQGVTLRHAFDQGDGQGFWNAVRADAAGELADWIESGYDGSGTDNALLLGDFNAYAKEDPVQTIAEGAAFTDLIETFIGQEDAFSFIFDGQQGALDQALASTGIAGRVTGVTEWHINAQEPDLLSYNSRFNDSRFFSEDVFAASDHDPLILGLDTQPDLLLG